MGKTKPRLQSGFYERFDGNLSIPEVRPDESTSCNLQKPRHSHIADPNHGTQFGLRRCHLTKCK